jgi:ribosomal protein L20
MENKTGLSKESKKRIKQAMESYNSKSNMYEMALRLGGVEHEEIVTLIKVLGLESKTGVDIKGLLSSTKEDYNKYRSMGIKAMEYIENDKKSRRLLFEKALYMNELESEEITKLIVGYYLSLCAYSLCVFVLC